MRKLAAAVLAVPVLLAVYRPLASAMLAGRRWVAVPIVAVVAVVAFAIVAVSGPAAAPTAARPPTPMLPVTAAAFGPAARADLAVTAGVTITFSRPMDPASVARSLSVAPSAPVALSWDPTGTTLTVAPLGRWDSSTYYTVTIGGAATDALGHPIGAVSRAVFVTRAATTATIAATVSRGTVVDARTGFSVAFDRPVDASAVAAAFRILPPVAGTFAAADGSTVVFQPTAPLAAGARYTVSLGGSLVDLGGDVVTLPDSLVVQTAAAPAVVRFRPLDGSIGVARDATLSVRFSMAMDRSSTAAAFQATANGHAITGRTSWAEGGTVLVLTPSALLPSGATIRMTVAAAARSAAGSTLAGAATATAHIVAASAALSSAKPPQSATKPVASATPKPAASAAPKTVVKASGGSAGSATWYAVEVYYLKLMNCTRTGGWVTSSGACSSPGGLATKPLVLDAGLSDKVSRPYAKLLATTGACDHFINGTPTDRLHRAGYSGWAAENIGCRSAATPYASMIFTQIFFQDEKPCGGYCHYANLMNPAYARCGIGVWVDHGRIRLVVDFYHA
ncbi:MAG: Ig-like domain-containing protein [Candidatus Limnocylindrales bacterium]